ncbi:MAG: putative zinc-binding metallopeptidase [Pseudomonadota bacterium]
MRLFRSPYSSERLYFNNLYCVSGTGVVWLPEEAVFAGLDAVQPCANRAEIGCNWAAEEAGTGYCRACAMTDVIPDTFHADNRALWAEAEASKRWVLATLARWGWFTDTDPGPRPIFHLLAEATRAGEQRVVMGHLSGVVTINVTEADPAERVERREELGERLRTMTGHFRHEIAHFLFERLLARPGFIEAFRATFGDERTDYAAALARHYAEGPPPGWQTAHVTRYASAHPHEDWAESAAHLLHLTDIADSAAAAGVHIEGLPADYDAYAEPDVERLITLASRLGIALNHVNRSMGLSDLYPFVLSDRVRAKLGFVHAWLSKAV